MGLPWWLSVKETACQCRKHRFDPWVWKTPGEGNGNPLQYSCLGNPMDRGGWRATVHDNARVRHDLAVNNKKGDNKAEIKESLTVSVSYLVSMNSSCGHLNHLPTCILMTLRCTRWHFKTHGRWMFSYRATRWNWRVASLRNMEDVASTESRKRGDLRSTLGFSILETWEDKRVLRLGWVVEMGYSQRGRTEPSS